MDRRSFVIAAAALCACSHAPRGPLLPGTVENWVRSGWKEMPATSAHDLVPRNSVERIETATYQGAGKADVTLYAMKSSAGSLDLVQRWRPAADSVFFNRDRYFVVVKWESADRRALSGFVRALEKSLGPRT